MHRLIPSTKILEKPRDILKYVVASMSKLESPTQIGINFLCLLSEKKMLIVYRKLRNSGTPLSKGAHELPFNIAEASAATVFCSSPALVQTSFFLMIGCSSRSVAIFSSSFCLI